MLLNTFHAANIVVFLEMSIIQIFAFSGYNYPKANYGSRSNYQIHFSTSTVVTNLSNWLLHLPKYVPLEESKNIYTKLEGSRRKTVWNLNGELQIWSHGISVIQRGWQLFRHNHLCYGLNPSFLIHSLMFLIQDFFLLILIFQSIFPSRIRCSILYLLYIIVLSM